MARLDEIINEVLLGAQDKKSLIFGKSKPQVVTVAKRGLQELYFSVLGQARSLTVDVPESRIVQPPVDFVKAVSLSSLNQANKLVPMYFDSRMAIQYEYLRSSPGGSLILDTVTGLPLKSYTPINDIDPYITNNDVPADYSWSQHYGQLYGIRGGYENGSGKYRWEPEARVWYIDDDQIEQVFIRYISNPLQRLDNDTIELDELFVETLKAYVVYSLIKYDRDTAASRIQMVKKEYDVLKKKAKMRNSMSGQELMQAARTQRGGFKF